jgi:hypothetical protein
VPKMELVAPRGLHPTAKNSQAAAIRASIDPAILMTLSIVLRIYPKLNAERYTLINVKATVPTKLHYPQPTQRQTYASITGNKPLEPSINHLFLVTDKTIKRHCQRRFGMEARAAESLSLKFTFDGALRRPFSKTSLNLAAC